MSYKRHWMLLFLAMLGFSAAFLAYYPPISGIEDEVGFINQTLVWSRGAVSSEAAGLGSDLADFALVNGRHVAQRHPGRSLIALPFFLIGGYRALFASGLVIQILLTLAAAKLLERLHKSPLWACLILFHPTLAIYSRTIMADAAAGLGILIAVLGTTYLARKGAILAGLGVGLAALMRYHAAIALTVIVLAFFLEPKRQHPTRDALLCTFAAAVCGIGIVAYNLAVFHSPGEPYTGTRGFFSIQGAPANILFYARALFIVWPLLLVSPFLDRSPIRQTVRGLVLLFLGSVIFYYFHDHGSNWLEELVLGQRLIQVVLPVWIVSYACVLDDWIAKPLARRLGPRAFATGAASLIVALVIATTVMFAKHNQHLTSYAQIRAHVITSVPEGALILHHGPLSKLFGVPIGAPRYRFLPVEYEAIALDWTSEIDIQVSPWYVAVAARVPGEPVPESAQRLVKTYHMSPVESGLPTLSIWKADPATMPAIDTQNPLP